MSNFTVRKVAVLGAGVMGAQIAAHCVNAGVPVVLFDLPGKDKPGQEKSGNPAARNAPAERAIAGLKKLRPAPLGIPALADLITPANYEDHLALLADCDLVIEAIAERIDWKHDLYRTVAPALGPNTIFASNTSGLSITALSEGFDADLRERFCGVHFFNPPRYMHLVELIPTPTTRPAILDQLEGFLTTTLGKGVVRARDTPNFIGNRVGVFGMLSVFAQAKAFGLPFDVVDDLTGARLGRAKSGTFRTADVVGLDTLAHVIATLRDKLPDDPFSAHFGTPEVLTALIEQGALGQKTGAGFYRKDGKKILRLDPASREYVPSEGKANETVAKILKTPDVGDRLRALRESDDPQARFVWAVLRDTFHYVAVHLADIADTAREVDFALRWGFGHQQGPFEIWQQAGWLRVARWIEEDIAAGHTLSDAPLPTWVTRGPVAERGGVHIPEGSWNAGAGRYEGRSNLPAYRRQVFRAPLAGATITRPADAGDTVFEDDSIRLWTLSGEPGGDVLIASFKTKMNTLGGTVVDGLMRAVELAERQYRGLVIWQTTEPFSAGADLQSMLPTFMSGGAKAIEPEERRLQDLAMRLRYAQVPTVAALAGMALGGGCELAVHCTRRVAHLETYIGLVEVGVGLVPGAGGLTFGARRAAELHAQAPDTELLHFLKRFVLQAATAQVSTSALEARAMGYLRDDDPIVFNSHELLYVAITQARALSEAGYRAPLKASFAVAGRDGAATLTGQLVNMRDGGFISDYDFQLGRGIVTVMCGGDVDPGSQVNEDWMLGLEREVFLGLLDQPKTQERIMGMLSTGKPVRN